MLRTFDHPLLDSRTRALRTFAHLKDSRVLLHDLERSRLGAELLDEDGFGAREDEPIGDLRAVHAHKHVSASAYSSMLHVACILE